MASGNIGKRERIGIQVKTRTGYDLCGRTVQVMTLLNIIIGHYSCSFLFLARQAIETISDIRVAELLPTVPNYNKIYIIFALEQQVPIADHVSRPKGTRLSRPSSAY